MVISALPVKRQRRVLATLKHGQWSSPLRRSSVNVGYLLHGSTDSGHLRFAGQASTSGTCDTEARTVVISALPVKRQRRVLATLKHGQWSSPLCRSSVNVGWNAHTFHTIAPRLGPGCAFTTQSHTSCWMCDGDRSALRYKRNVLLLISVTFATVSGWRRITCKMHG